VEAHGGLESLVLALISAREDARKRKDYAASDAIRKRLSEAGIVLEDRKDGSTGWRLAG
jgi:cysteinyl-tRNA synthetase